MTFVLPCPKCKRDAAWNVSANGLAYESIECSHCDQSMTVRAQVQRALERRAA